VRRETTQGARRGTRRAAPDIEVYIMFKRALIALSLLMLATPAFATERDPVSSGAATVLQAPAATRVLPGRATPATRSDRSRYAAREAASPEAKQYKGGGDVVIIGSSALVIVLLVVLIIVLI
jgi:hypothetical protein